ncbi:MAG TPA: efflux transporter outer membrane subunit [Caldimonas sp.]|nr:efflux transporter outer membrane subunit [Caldimonas sp.]HEV7574506.1 efflux transporter outer membrane subunit [Caldimonas sp.]
MTMRRFTASLAAALAAALAGCALGPDYVRPSAPVSAAYKEAPVAGGALWLPAAPADALDRGDWWRLFDDPELSRLAAEVDAANQTVAGAVASYRQAEALVREARASFFPAVSLAASGRRSGGGNNGDFSSGSSSSGGSFSASLTGDWAPDFWGRVGRAVESARASEQASAADLASARLSAQGSMAVDYFALRESDYEADLLVRTIAGYERALQITQNRYAAGIVAKTDVLQAETQLATTRSSLATVRANRERFEHAIAALTGKAPGDFAIAVQPWNAVVPGLPIGVPSALLQRRPDIASAERQVAATNAQIGIERAGYFPSVTLSASLANSSSRIGDLFKVSNALWSVGASLAQTIFDAGATAARVSAAEAGRDVAVARYRQTVLTAFQGVEDQLTNARAQAEQAELLKQASDAADQTEQQILNRYRAGQLSYTDVVTAQASALSARRALVQMAVNRQVTAITLIQALGGGWDAAAPVEIKSSVRVDNPR